MKLRWILITVFILLVGCQPTLNNSSSSNSSVSVNLESSTDQNNQSSIDTTPTVEKNQQSVPSAIPQNPPTKADYNCSDFATQQEAQIVFNQNAPNDPYDLDREHDGIVCESLK
jgi:hypothetical protein